MHIENHGYNVVVRGMNRDDISELCNILGIAYEQFTKSEYDNVLYMKYAFGKNKKSVFIKHSGRGEKSYTLLILKGGFYDHSPDFRFKELLNFFSRFKHTPKQLDVAFNDNDRYLRMKKLRGWCRHCNDYGVGSLFTRDAPDNLYRLGKSRCIRLGSADSTVNYATIYRRPKTGIVRIEIKFRGKKKIEHILERYSDKNPQQFEARSLGALVSCMNFVTARSKKNRVASKYEKLREWRSFLGSDIERINWREIYAVRRKNRMDADNVTFDITIRRNATMVRNMVNKLKVLRSEEDILNLFAAYSGYRLVKVEDNF